MNYVNCVIWKKKPLYVFLSQYQLLLEWNGTSCTIERKKCVDTRCNSRSITTMKHASLLLYNDTGNIVMFTNTAVHCYTHHSSKKEIIIEAIAKLEQYPLLRYSIQPYEKYTGLGWRILLMRKYGSGLESFLYSLGYASAEKDAL